MLKTLTLFSLLLLISCGEDKNYSTHRQFDGVLPGSYFYPESLKTDFTEYETKWNLSKNGLVQSPPATSHGLTIVGKNSGILEAIETKEGKVRWSLHTEPTNTSPFIYQDKVLWGTGEKLRLLNLQTGATLWEKKGQLNANHQPLIDSDEVYMVDGLNHLFIFDLATGDTLWHNEEIRISGPIRLDESSFYLASPEGEIRSYNRETGEEEWLTEIGRGPIGYYSNIYLENEVLYLPTPSKNFLALDVNDGRILWEYGLGMFLSTGFAADEEHLYLSVDRREFAALNKQTGEEIWKIETQNFIEEPTVYHNSVLLKTETGYLKAVDKKTGQTQWDQRIARMFTAPPFLADGVLYLNNDHFYRALE